MMLMTIQLLLSGRVNILLSICLAADAFEYITHFHLAKELIHEHGMAVVLSKRHFELLRLSQDMVLLCRNQARAKEG